MTEFVPNGWYYALTISSCGKLVDGRNNAQIFINQAGLLKLTTWKGQGGFGKHDELNYQFNIKAEQAQQLKVKIENFDFSHIKLRSIYPLDIPFVTVQLPTTGEDPKVWSASVDEAFSDAQLKAILDEYIGMINKLISRQAE